VAPDAITFCEVLLIIMAVLWWESSPGISVVVIISVLIFVVFLHQPFERAERHARAIRRRSRRTGTGKRDLS